MPLGSPRKAGGSQGLAAPSTHGHIKPHRSGTPRVTTRVPTCRDSIPTAATGTGDKGPPGSQPGGPGSVGAGGGSTRLSYQSHDGEKKPPGMKQVKVWHLLMDGLEELTLVFPNFGMVDLLHQLGVFVDEPRFPEYVGSSIFHLGAKEGSGVDMAGPAPWLMGGCRIGTVGGSYPLR